MSDFITILKDSGLDDAENLMAEVEWFLDEPAVFFEMTPEERAALMNRMDEALAAM